MVEKQILIFALYRRLVLDFHQWVPFCVKVFSSLCFRFGSPTHCNAVQPLKEQHWLVVGQQMSLMKGTKVQTHTDSHRTKTQTVRFHTHRAQMHMGHRTRNKSVNWAISHAQTKERSGGCSDALVIWNPQQCQNWTVWIAIQSKHLQGQLGPLVSDQIVIWGRLWGCKKTCKRSDQQFYKNDSLRQLAKGQIEGKIDRMIQFSICEKNHTLP